MPDKKKPGVLPREVPIPGKIPEIQPEKPDQEPLSPGYEPEIRPEREREAPSLPEVLPPEGGHD